MIRPEWLISAAFGFILGVVAGAFIATPAQGQSYGLEVVEALAYDREALLDEALEILDEAQALLRAEGPTPEVGALADEAQAIRDKVRAHDQAVEGSMRGGELQAPSEGGALVPLVAAPPSLEATGIEGVVVLVKPVEDLSGPSVYALPQTLYEQWDELPLIVQFLWVGGIWALILSMLMLITSRGIPGVERTLHRAAGRIIPKRRGW